MTLRLIWPALSALLWAGVSLCYALRPDACAAVTLLPPWAWPVPGLLLAALAVARPRVRSRSPGRTPNQAPKGAAVAAAILWLGFLLAFAEEPRSLFRGLVPAHVPAGAIRVVSLNCAGGSGAAAAEVARYRPDVVLLQETPGRDEVEALGRRLFGAEAGVLCGVDTSILTRGPLAAMPVPRGTSTFVQARSRLASGLEGVILSLRLTPPSVRLDLWSSGCWTEQRENRQARRRQMEEIAAQIASLPGETPLILGGDFNAPAGDGIVRLLQPRLRDTFAEGGAGWGNTALNDFPISRIDQVWISRHFRAVRVTARRTHSSDHRLVVCDLAAR